MPLPRGWKLLLIQGKLSQYACLVLIILPTAKQIQIIFIHHVMHALHTKMWILSGFGQSALPVHMYTRAHLRDLQTNKLQTPTNRKPSRVCVHSMTK